MQRDLSCPSVARRVSELRVLSALHVAIIVSAPWSAPNFPYLCNGSFSQMIVIVLCFKAFQKR